MLRFGASIGLLVLLLVAWPGGGISTVRPAQAEELDYDIIGGHFFTQANGQGGAGGTGFAVTNEGGIRFWDEFRRLGGVEVIGYPISTRFIWNGFTVQAFQKIVLQWRPEVGEAYFVNVVDEMHNRGLDEALAVSRSTPAIADWAADAGLSWDQVVEHHRAVLVADPALQAKYFSVDDPTLRFGLPMAPIADYGSVAVLRAQRVILQHWKVQTPWANPGDVVIANGADVAKELGVFDPQVLTPQPAPPAAARSTRYGIVAHPGAPRQLQALREAGASLTVLEVLWRDVEPSPTGPAQFDWSRIDPLFENVRSAGVLPVVLVQGNPTWAWAPGDSGVIHPDRYGDFAEFVHALVTRYRGYTPYWSFYNEPDCNGPVTPQHPLACWGDVGAAYAQMLRTVYPAVKQADPNAQVIFGGIAFDNFQVTNGFARDFVPQVLAAGGGEAFDIMNFHYFTGFRPVWEPYGVDVQGKIAVLRSTLGSYGVMKPFIATEIGTGSSGPGESQESQARYVAQGQARSLAAGVQTLIWYDLTDTGDWSFGLMTPALQPRASYQAYQTFVRTVGNRPFQRALDAGDLGTEGVEAYEFGGSDGQRVIVAWSVDQSEREVWLTSNGGRLMDLYGASRGIDAGQVVVAVGPQPVYFEVR